MSWTSKHTCSWHDKLIIILWILNRQAKISLCYFNFSVPSALAKELYETKDKTKNNELVEEIKNKWSDLKDEIKKMSEDEKEIEQPDKTLKIVEEILDFNTKIRKKQG